MDLIRLARNSLTHSAHHEIPKEFGKFSIFLIFPPIFLHIPYFPYHFPPYSSFALHHIPPFSSIFLIFPTPYSAIFRRIPFRPVIFPMALLEWKSALRHIPQYSRHSQSVFTHGAYLDLTRYRGYSRSADQRRDIAICRRTNLGKCHTLFSLRLFNHKNFTPLWTMLLYMYSSSCSSFLD